MPLPIKKISKYFVPLMLAIPAIAGPALVFSVGDISFNPSIGFRTGAGAAISVTGIDTPLHSGVTMPGLGGGFNWNPSITGVDSNNWYFQATDIIIEAQFNFTDGFTKIPIFTYTPNGGTPDFQISRNGILLTFDVPTAMPIDARLAAFYGLAPPCPASTPPGGCANPNFPTSQVTADFIGQEIGPNQFSASIKIEVVPEAATSLLLAFATVMLCLVTRRNYHKYSSGAI